MAQSVVKGVCSKYQLWFGQGIMRSGEKTLATKEREEALTIAGCTMKLGVYAVSAYLRSSEEGGSMWKLRWVLSGVWS